MIFRVRSVKFNFNFNFNTTELAKFKWSLSPTELDNNPLFPYKIHAVQKSINFAFPQKPTKKNKRACPYQISNKTNYLEVHSNLYLNQLLLSLYHNQTKGQLIIPTKKVRSDYHLSGYISFPILCLNQWTLYHGNAQFK